MPIPAPWRKLLLAVHITLAVALVGTDLALLVLGIAGLHAADPRSVYPAARLVGAWVLAPLAVLALITGVVQAVTSRWGLLRYWWVGIKFAIAAVLTALVLFVLLPALGAAAGGTAEVPDTRRTALAVAPAAAATLLVVSAFLAVYKPRWRIRPQAGR
ncbi:MAG TPA: hypothetical protein VF054_07685 [Micromonosporaceae bacterium]